MSENNDININKNSLNIHCKKWKTIKIRNCTKCHCHSFVLVKKHTECGDYYCSICGEDCDWFWYCRKKCGVEPNLEVDNDDIT